MIKGFTEAGIGLQRLSIGPHHLLIRALWTRTQKWKVDVYWPTPERPTHRLALEARNAAGRRGAMLMTVLHVRVLTSLRKPVICLVI